MFFPGPGSTGHCIYGFSPPQNPGQNPGQKPCRKSGGWSFFVRVQYENLGGPRRNYEQSRKNNVFPNYFRPSVLGGPAGREEELGETNETQEKSGETRRTTV